MQPPQDRTISVELVTTHVRIARVLLGEIVDDLLCSLE